MPKYRVVAVKHACGATKMWSLNLQADRLGSTQHKRAVVGTASPCCVHSAILRCLLSLAQLAEPVEMPCLCCNNTDLCTCTQGLGSCSTSGRTPTEAHCPSGPTGLPLRASTAVSETGSRSTDALSLDARCRPILQRLLSIETLPARDGWLRRYTTGQPRRSPPATYRLFPGGDSSAVRATESCQTCAGARTAAGPGRQPPVAL